jgi:hypothetical protein
MNAILGADGAQYAQERLLLYILNRFAGTQTAAQLDEQHLSEIRTEVLLNGGIAFAQPL